MIQGEQIYFYPKIDSTNRQLRELILANNADYGAVCIADEQTAGRGRLGRSFLSPAGSGIYMSVYVKAVGDIYKITSISAVAAVAVCKAIEFTTGYNVGIKWINDIYFKGKKVAGILCETVSDISTNHIKGVIIGVGVNCLEPKNGFPNELADKVISLGLRDTEQMDMLASALVKNLRLAVRYSEEEWLSYYRTHSVVLGERVIVHPVRHEPYEAVAEEIDNSGALVVIAESGEYVTLKTGEISLNLA